MNQQFDVIIIGDSKAGNDTLKAIASKSPTIKIAFISREFKDSTTRDFLNVEYITDEVIFTDYRNRLFGCYLKGGARHYCTHLIVASGLRYEPLKLGNKLIPNVFNSADNISRVAKNLQAVVLGKTDADAKLAIAAAKKYKYVYFCTENMSPNISCKNIEKLANIANLVVLPNTSIVKFNADTSGLRSIELDNYSTVTCSAIFTKTKSTPEVDFVSTKLIARDNNGYLTVDSKLESTLVPKCFALGNCTRKSTKTMSSAMIESILKDFE